MIDITRAYGLTFYFPAGDRAVGRALRENGEFARVEMEFYAALMDGCEPGAFVDVGANVGAISLPLARARPDWRFLAFEANRDLHGLLSTNINVNFLGNVAAHHAAVSAEAGLAAFPTPPMNASVNYGALGFDIRAAVPREPVRTCRLDEVCPDDTRLVKIDVEGHEPEVFAGAARVLAEVRPALVFEASQKRMETVRPILALLLAQGYSLFWFSTPFVSGRPHKISTYRPPLRGDMNVIALPDGRTPPWPLPPVDGAEAPYAEDRALFGYLADYGLSEAEPG